MLWHTLTDMHSCCCTSKTALAVQMPSGISPGQTALVCRQHGLVPHSRHATADHLALACADVWLLGLRVVRNMLLSCKWRYHRATGV